MADAGTKETDLGAKLEAIERKMEEVDAAASRAKMTGRIMTVVIAVVAIALVLMLIKPFVDAYNNPEPYKQELQAGLQERIVPRIESEAKIFANDLRPILEDALEKSEQNYLPEVVDTLETQGQLLIEELSVDVNAKMEQFQMEYQMELRDMVYNAFPELQDEENTEEMIERLNVVAQRVIDRITRDLFKQHYEALLALEENFNSIEVPEEMRQMSPEELDEHISTLVFELMNAKINEFNKSGG